MSKKIAVEVKIVEFFKTAPLETAKSVMNICQAVIRDRSGDAPATPKRRRREQALGADPLAETPVTE